MTRQTKLPRWRGFNLLEMFTTKHDGQFLEDDFRWIAELGFDFVRLPMCYLLWLENNDVYQIKESMVENIDRAIRLGQQYGLHVDLNFHRGPGYSVNRERQEPFSLWKDQEALDAFIFHWTFFTKRYKGISSEDLSFNLLNEPPEVSDLMQASDHERVMRATVAAIREIDPDRLIILDGLDKGNFPCFDLADLGVGQSCRGYVPHGLSHYKAPWTQYGMEYPRPDWPNAIHKDWTTWDLARLEQHYADWARLADQQVGVHCGEAGCYIHTDHDVFLRWFDDVLNILTSYHMGYALWNFRGDFGILDSNRKDVDYEDWNGHKLDRKLLNLIQKY